VVLDDGSCEAKCEPDKCIEGNVCAGNRCRLVCDTHDDCFFGTQECAVVTNDSSGAPVSVCVENGRQPVMVNGFPEGGFGFGCPFGESQCTATACPNGLECDLNACPDCARDTGACKAAGRALGVADLNAFVDQHCNIGRCGDGSACTFNTCAPNECTAMTCITKGEGDAEAYCTHNDCVDDSGCPSGYYCGATRDPRDICGPTCNAGACSDDGDPCQGDGDCQKGNNGICGQTTEPCLDPSQFNANGASFFEGSICLLRRTCLKRNECARCESHVDCSRGLGDVCTEAGADKVCARFCADDTDCRSDQACQPALVGGNHQFTCKASPRVACGSPADCPALADGNPDECVPRFACVPRSGSCFGGGFCSHCLDDTDCGDASTRSACVSVTDGQNACYDFGAPSTCATGSDSECPQSPGGAFGECLDEGEQVSSSSPSYRTCWFPFDDADSRFTCFP
jgi:hypothetical protein